MAKMNNWSLQSQSNHRLCTCSGVWNQSYSPPTEYLLQADFSLPVCPEDTVNEPRFPVPIQFDYQWCINIHDEHIRSFKLMLLLTQLYWDVGPSSVNGLTGQRSRILHSCIWSRSLIADRWVMRYIGKPVYKWGLHSRGIAPLRRGVYIEHQVGRSTKIWV